MAHQKTRLLEEVQKRLVERRIFDDGAARAIERLVDTRLSKIIEETESDPELAKGVAHCALLLMEGTLEP